MDVLHACEFIVKRRRKRSGPVDRNLDYSQSSLTPRITFLADNQQFDSPVELTLQDDEVDELEVDASESSNHDNHAIPECLQAQPELEVHVSDQQPDNMKPQITVEEFLQWSAKSPKPLKSKKRKRRYVDLSDTIASPYDSDLVVSRSRKRIKIHELASECDDGEYRPSLSDDSDHEEPKTTRPNVSRSKRKNPEPFSTRMLRAAVLSHVDVGVANEVVSTGGRKPLNFEPALLTSPKPPGPASSPKWRLIDPRTVAMPAHADFPLLRRQRESNAQGETHAHRRISDWRALLRPMSAPAASAKKKTTSRDAGTAVAKVTGRHVNGRRPLTFVPLAEHESGISAMFQHSRVSRGLRTPARATQARTSSRKPLPNLSHLSGPPNTSRDTTSQRSLTVAAFDSDAPPSSPLEGFSSSPATPPRAVYGLSTPVHHNCDGAVCCSEDRDSRSGPPLAQDHSVSPRVKAEYPSPDHQAQRIYEPPRPPASACSSGPLKPLGSFLNGFLETARYATKKQQAESTTKQTLKRPRPRPSSRV